MKEHPILFSTPMVQAILSGQKTMTRRTRGLEKLNAEGWVYSHCSTDKDVEFPLPADAKKPNDPWYLFHPSNGNHKSWIIQCPYGAIGDVLWVREKFCLTQPYNPNTYYFGYAYGDHSYIPASTKYDFAEPDVWKPSIHMPREACRIRLRITKIRIEQLQEISEEDAIAEGIISTYHEGMQYYFYPCNDLRDDTYLGNPITSFYSLWTSINGAGSWDKNPWVWVIEFERI